MRAGRARSSARGGHRVWHMAFLIRQHDPGRGSKLLCPWSALRVCLPEIGTGDSSAAARSAPGFYRRRVAEESTRPTANLVGRAPHDSPYSSPQAKACTRIMEPTMARPLKLVPDPYVVTLRRICVAQVMISLSALASTAVLLSRVVTVMNGSE
jgi:hypothetical protein